MNIGEKNKLVAEFMNFEWFEINKPYIAVRKPNGGVKHFQTDWNDLMEVVEKIETLPDEKFQIEINGKWCNFFDMKTFKSIEFEKAENESKIQNCFEAVVMFIRWYNDKTIEFWEQDFEYLNS